jgi:hypothetical protein
VEVIRFEVPDTDVTPVPAGVVHVPAPDQYVDADALVPEFKLVTGILPLRLIVIDAEPLATRMFCPELIAAAVGAAPVVPMKICPADKAAIDGTPAPLVTSIPLFAVASPLTVFAVALYNSVLTAYVSANVLVVASQFVPLERNIVPVAPTVVGNEAVDQMLAPPDTDCRNLPVALGLAKNEGTLLLLVINTPPTAVVISPIALAEEEYKIWLEVLVAGQVVVDHAGAELAPDCNICPAVAVLDKIAPALAVE